MRNLLHFFICLAVAVFSLRPNVALAQIVCGTNQSDSLLRVRFPGLPGLAEFEQEMAKKIGKHVVQTKRNTEGIIKIPVVVHVLHNGEPLGNGRNISDAQVLSQIKVMNDDFRRKPGTRGFNTFPNGADTRIEFEMSQRNPQGEPSNGIVRYNASSLNWGTGSISTAFINATIKPSTIWDPNQYLNVWVINLGNGFFGYGQFPFFSGLLGFDCFGIGTTTGIGNTDGVVLNHICFGSNDDENFPILVANRNKGKVMTHELGHYFGLRHIWGDGSCGSDFCEDTPTHDGPTNGCPSTQQTNNCNGPSNIELYQDYMDYSNDLCINVFTKDQAMRMRTVLENSPRRKQLTYSPGGMAPQLKDASLSDVSMVYKDQCAGAQPVVSVSVINTGINSLASVQLKYNLNGAALQTRDRTLNLTYMEVSTFDINLTGTVAAGTNTLTLWVEQSNGTNDFASRLDTFVIVFQSTGGQAVPFTEAFENEAFPAPLWTIRNPDTDCFEWRQQSVPQGSTGSTTGAYFLKLANQTFLQGQKDQLISPLIRVNGLTRPGLSFDLAFVNPQSLPTAFRVFVSTNCGDTWLPNPIFEKAGSALRTTGLNVSDFIPNNQNQWRKEQVSLSSFDGQTIRLMFELESWGGNNFYFDNVLIDAMATQLPTVTSFTPGSGPPSSTVQISGTNFVTGTLAYFNGFQAATTINSTTQITVTVPAAASTGYISVANSNGSGVSDSIFKVTRAPNITYFAPLSGMVGTSVSVFGRDFLDVTSVAFNGTAANFSIVSPTEMLAIVPVGATTGLIRATNASGTAQSATAFIVGEVYITGNGTLTTCSGTLLDPGGNGNYPSNLDVVQTIRPSTPDSRISIRFTNFSTVGQYDYMIAYNGPSIFSPQIAAYSGNIASFNVLSSHPTGALTFQFISNGTVESTGFEANISCQNNDPPTITAFAPDTGLRGSRVVVQGSNFTPESVVRFNGTAATSVDFLGTNEIAAIVPPTATTGLISVNTVFGSATSTNIFVIDTTVQLRDNYCPVLQAACGTAFITNVRIPGTQLNNSSACSNNLNRAYAQYLPGAGTSGTLLRNRTYHFQISLSSFSITTVGLWIDFNNNGLFDASEYFAQTTGGTSIRTINVTVPPNAVIGWTGMRIRTRNSAVVATNPCTNFSSGETEDYYIRIQPNLAPIIENFSPIYGLTGTAVNITGLNFDNIQSVSFNGTNASFNLVSPTSITATVPQGASTGKIVVSNQFGTDTSITAFYVTNVRPFLVLLLHSETNGAAHQDVKAKLEAFGVIDQIDQFNANQATPSLALLSTYDVVFVWNAGTWQDRNNLGTNLSAYIEQGGNVVKGLYATAGSANSNPGGAFSNYDLIPFGSSIISTSGLGSVLIPTHPIIQGVSTFLGGTQSARSNTLLVNPGADRIANWQDNRPLIVARAGFPTLPNVRKVDLGFYPPSSSVSTTNWVALTSGARIMVNALLWAGNRESAIYAIPEFADFTPRSGDVGAQVTLSGKRFNAMNSVRFNGLEASFNIVNDSTITTIVPTGASTGFIQIGSASGASLQSPGIFLVGNELRMTNGTFTLCDGKFLSSEYVNTTTPGYQNAEQYVLTINPTDPAAKLRVAFSFFNTELNYDFLTIFNGPSSSSPILGQYSGSSLPPTFTSTHPSGALSFRFLSDNSEIRIGWDAQLSCIFPTPVITTLTPNVGQIGSPVTISGTSLSNPSAVRFNGVEANIISASPTQILTLVPMGATTGNVQVVTPTGTASSPQVFNICNEFANTPQTLDTVSRCGPGQLILTASGATGNNTYRWYATENATTVLGTGATLTRTITGSTSFFVAFHNPVSNCTGSRKLVFGNILETPNAGFSGLNNQYCQGDSSLLLMPVLAGGTFSPNVVNNRFFALQTGIQTVQYQVFLGTCSGEFSLPVEVLVRPLSGFTTNGSQLAANIIQGATYQWLLNGAIIAGATNANYTAVSGGLYRLIVRLGICADTSEATQISELAGFKGAELVFVYPNPFEASLYVKGLNPNEKMEFTLLNSLGQTIEVQATMKNGGKEAYISTSHIPAGMYLLNLKTNTGLMRKKVEKVN